MRITCTALISLSIAAIAAADEVTVCAQPDAIVVEGAAVSVPLTVVAPNNATIDAVRVDLDLEHPWIGDLVVTLTHDGASALLLDRVSLGAYPFGCGGDDVLATFRDDATQTLESLCAPGVVPNIAGDVLPASSLGVFVGAPAEGEWELAITDATPFDSGTLREVCVTVVFSVSGVACSPADITTDGTSNGVPDGAVTLSDFSLYLSRWSLGETSADVTLTGQCLIGSGGDGVDLSDFSCFLNTWSQGCP